MVRVPNPAGGNQLTVREYQRRWLDMLVFVTGAPLAGRLAGRLEPDGQRIRVVETLVPATGAGVLPHAMVVGELAREERRPRGAAQRVRDEAVREGRPLFPEEGASLGEDPHVRHGLVVRHDDQHVGSLGVRRGGPQRGEAER